MTDDLEHHRITPVVKALLVAVAVTILLLAAFYMDSNRRADDLDRKADALAESLAARAEVIDELATGQQTLRAQLEEEGIEPEVPPPSQTIREVIRETGATGAQGIQGVAGVAGRDGRDGITPACWFEQSQCVGATGPQGATGATGPAGRDGVDGQDGAAGPQGETGATGAPGPAGSNGSDGAPGPACPAGYEPRVMEQGPYQGWIACAPTGAP